MVSLSANGEQGKASDVAPPNAVAQPARIIAAGGVVTEIVYALGRSDALVGLMAVPAFAATPAAKSKSILIFDGGYLLSFGPRTPSAARDLLLAAYPELAKPDKRSDLQ